MTTRAEEIAGDGPYMVALWPDDRPRARKRYTIKGPTPCDSWWHNFGEVRSRVDSLNAAHKQGQHDRWISVKDQLPQKGVTVLVLGPTEDGDGIGLDALDPDSDGATWIKWNNAHERYVTCGVPESIGPGEEAKYTHWSPIPSPPNPEQR